MKKKLSLLLATIIVFTSLTSGKVWANRFIYKGLEEVKKNATTIDMYIDEQEVAIPSDMGSIYLNKDSRTMVPLRFVSEKLGHKVEWDKNDRKVSIDSGKIEMKIGSNKPIVNGKEETIDTEAVLVASRTYVPIRFISETLGYDVMYGRGSDRTAVFIFKDKEPSKDFMLAYKNDVLLIDEWEWNKIKVEGSYEEADYGGTWKEIKGKQTHEYPGYIDVDDSSTDRRFKIRKSAGGFPAGYPVPIFYVDGMPYSLDLYITNMGQYSKFLGPTSVRTYYRDEQARYNKVMLSDYPEDLNGQKPTGFIYDYTEPKPLETEIPSSRIYETHAGDIWGSYNPKTLEHLGYPKDDMFKVRLVIDSVDKRTNKPFSVTYDVDFRMPFNE